MSESFNKLKRYADEKFNINAIPEDFVANLIYNSLVLEKPIITLDRVKAILAGNKEDGLAAYVLNQQKAFNYVVDCVKEGKQLSADIIKNIHAILFSGIEEGAGSYRNVNIRIPGSQHVPYEPTKIYGKMDEYIYKLYQINDYEEGAAYAHLQLAKIHPFLNGNGRVARLVLNFALMERGYAPVLILEKDKEQYFGCLETYKVKKEMGPFLDYLTLREQEAIRAI